MKRLFIAISLSMSMWACGGGSPTTPTAAPSPAPASPFAVVTGNYELTIEIDDKCAQIPPTLRVRRYNATLEDRGWHFLPVNVVGGGFATPVLMADSVAAICRRPMAACVEQLRRRRVRLSRAVARIDRTLCVRRRRRHPERFNAVGRNAGERVREGQWV